MQNATLKVLRSVQALPSGYRLGNGCRLTGVAGVTVQVRLASDNSLVTSTVTDANGNWMATQLTSGVSHVLDQMCYPCPDCATAAALPNWLLGNRTPGLNGRWIKADATAGTTARDGVCLAFLPPDAGIPCYYQSITNLNPSNVYEVSVWAAAFDSSTPAGSAADVNIEFAVSSVDTPVQPVSIIAAASGGVPIAHNLAGTATTAGAASVLGVQWHLTTSHPLAPPARWRQLARQCPLPLLYWLEQADLRGRVCPDLGGQLEILELFRLRGEELALWGTTDPWADWRAALDAAFSQRSEGFRAHAAHGCVQPSECRLPR